MEDEIPREWNESRVVFRYFDFKLFTIIVELIITYWNYNELGTCIAHVHLFVVSFIFLLGKLCKLFCSLCYSIMLNRVLMYTPPFTQTLINRGEGHSFEQLIIIPNITSNYNRSYDCQRKNSMQFIMYLLYSVLL